MEITNPKYIVLYREDGVSKELRFPRGPEGKADAVEAYKEKYQNGWAKLFSIDSEDSDIWYDLSEKALHMVPDRNGGRVPGPTVETIL